MSSESFEGIGTRLRKARDFLGVSQEFAARELGLNRSALSDIERGARRVTSNEVVAFSRLYGVPTDQLLGAASPEGDGTLIALNRAAGHLTKEDREEVLRFAQFLRTRSGMTETDG